MPLYCASSSVVNTRSSLEEESPDVSEEDSEEVSGSDSDEDAAAFSEATALELSLVGGLTLMLSEVDEVVPPQALAKSDMASSSPAARKKVLFFINASKFWGGPGRAAVFACGTALALYRLHKRCHASAVPQGKPSLANGCDEICGNRADGLLILCIVYLRRPGRRCVNGERNVSPAKQNGASQRETPLPFLYKNKPVTH